MSNLLPTQHQRCAMSRRASSDACVRLSPEFDSLLTDILWRLSASRSAHWSHNPKDGGSNPSDAFFYYKTMKFCLVENRINNQASCDTMSTSEVLQRMQRELGARLSSVNKIQKKLPAKFWPAALLQERKVQLEHALGNCENLCRFYSTEVSSQTKSK